jgi:hypothetical protein
LDKEKWQRQVLENPETGRRGPSDCLLMAVGCEAVAAMADVAVAPDGTVSWLKKSMRIAAEFAANIVRGPWAWASWVAGLDGRRLVVGSLHAIALVACTGMPRMVLLVFPAGQGKATTDVNAAVGEIDGTHAG